MSEALLHAILTENEVKLEANDQELSGKKRSVTLSYIQDLRLFLIKQQQ